MRILFLIFFLSPILCSSQIRTENFITPTKKFLELIEVEDKLFGISKPIDTLVGYNYLDSVYYLYKITPYPDQAKKYELVSFFRVILYLNNDTLINNIQKASFDSGYLSIVIPAKYPLYTLKVFLTTRYKRKKWKRYKEYTDQVIYSQIESRINTRFYRRNIICINNYSGIRGEFELLNEIREKHSGLTTDQLIILTVPGAQ